MELKSCPFCGGKADIHRKWGRNGYIIFVECSVCKSSSHVFGDGINDITDKDSVAWLRAQQAWNLRAGGSDGQPDS